MFSEVNTTVLQGGLKKTLFAGRLQTSPKQTIKTLPLREMSSRIIKSGFARDIWSVGQLTIVVLLLTFSAGFAAENSEQFIRVVRNAAGEPQALQTAVVQFKKDIEDQVIELDLYSAVHVGEADYYQQLNREFKAYEAVLYELVAAEGHVVNKDADSGSSLLSRLQLGFTDLLGLRFQLQEIDYQVPNFVHADLSPAEFYQAMKDRGETLGQLLSKLFAASYAEAAKNESRANNINLLLLFLQEPSPQRARAFRRLFAEEIEGSDALISVLNGEEGSTLVTVRNDRVLAVLNEQIAKGKRRIAVFFGGGHMEDLKKKLEAQFGMRHTGTRWLTAWSLK